MRVQTRNKQDIYYANYSSITDYTKDGYKTGEKTITYTSPTLLQATLSANKGTSEIDQFGTNLAYDRVIITDDLTCSIDENSHLWVDKTPIVDGVVQPYNYIVSKVAKSLNYISIAIKRVDVS